MISKILPQFVKIEQHETHWKSGENSGAPKGEQFLLQ